MLWGVMNQVPIQMPPFFELCAGRMTEMGPEGLGREAKGLFRKTRMFVGALCLQHRMAVSRHGTCVLEAAQAGA